MISKEYLRDLQMQSRAVDKVLEDIKEEIYELSQWYMNHDMEDIAMVITTDVMNIIDKRLRGDVDEE